MEIAQQVPRGVAHLAVDVCQLAQDAGTDRHIGGVVDGAHPQPQHISAVRGLLLLVLAAFDDHHRINDVAQRFAHLAALFIQGEAVGQHGAVGGVTVDCDGREQGALEPAAVLVGAFQVGSAG